jgi:hypothetical protein
MRSSARFTFKFALLHGMIVVAGIAVCFSMRYGNLRYSLVISQAIEEWRTEHSILLLVKKAQGLFLDTPPYVAIGTLTVFLMGFCPPRPALRRLTRQPGFVACFAASSVILMSIALDLVELWAYRHVDVISARVGPQPFFNLVLTLTQNEQYPGYAVGVAWGLLWLGGRWRSDPSQLEGLGRALGYYWLAFIFLGKFFSVGHYY